MSFDESDAREDTLKLDFANPEFITRNIDYKRNFEEYNIINEECRTRMIHTSCDQVCFYVYCVLKAYEALKEIPTIVVYGGGGVMGSSVIHALIEMGCKPLLKVYARDPVIVQKWLDAGVRSTIKFEKNAKLDIMIICSNIMSFSQLCRDVGHCLKPTTFVISTVFSLQRKRIFNLFEAPGVVRTFVERKMSKRKKFSSAKLLLYRKDSTRSIFLVVENFMVLLGIEPAIARELCFDLFLGRNNVHDVSLPVSRADNHFGGGELKPLSVIPCDVLEPSDYDSQSPASFMSSVSPCASSSDMFTPIKPGISHASSDDLSSYSPQPPGSPSLPSINSHFGSRPNTSEKTMQLKNLSVMIQNLEVSYGISFSNELTKHIGEVKLPSLNAIRASKVLNPVIRQHVKHIKKNRRGSTRDVMKTPKHTGKISGYLDGDTLLRIFSCDKKAAPDVKTSDFLEYINSLSDSDGDDDIDNIDVALERMHSVSGDIFDNEASDSNYIVKNNPGISGLSRMESDIFIGREEGKRFNVPSVIKEIVTTS